MKQIGPEGIGRQGDVCLQRVSEMPKGEPAKAEGGRIILAHGEATGHHHSVPVEDVEAVITDNGELFLDFCRDSVLSHLDGAGVNTTDHDPISVPAGTYRRIQQVEYTPQGLRNVAD